MSKIKTWKRILAMCLCFIMMLGVSACGGGDADDDGSGKLNATTDDKVVDMEGYEVTIASNCLVDEPNLSEVTAAEAIFEEVRHKVEKEYNCKIKILAIDNTIENVRTKVLAGDKIADIIDVEGFNLLPMARAGYIIPLEGVEGLNIKDSRYIQGYSDFTEFNGKHYGLNFMRPAEARVCMIYNRDLLEKYGISEDPQELMKSNKWTFDKFREMCKTATRDTNGDGQNDSYGCYVALPQTFGLSMISANNGKLVSTEGGVASESFNDTKVLNALNFVYDLVNKDKTVAYGDTFGTGFSEKDAIAKFVKS